MMKRLTTLFFLVIVFNAPKIHAKDKVIGNVYFQNFLGHVHENMSKDSTSLTVVQCGHYVKILKHSIHSKDWTYVKVGEDKGFVQTTFLSKEKPKCLQGKYPKFYNNLSLDITEMYYWGKLYDQYFVGTSEIK